LGWEVFDGADVNSRVVAERFGALTGEGVGCEFVKNVGGRALLG
jgi:hypothetical protein